MSTALPKQRLEAALTKLPPDLRREVETGWRKKMKYRKSSELYANNYARMLSRIGIMEIRKRCGPPLTERERMLALKIREFLSYREIEEFLHLKPQSGNDAQRLINSERERRRRGHASRMTVRQFRKLAENFAEGRPTAVKAVFKKIVMDIPRLRRHHDCSHRVLASV